MDVRQTGAGPNAKGGQTLTELCSGLDMARQSVSKHLAVLESAALVTTVWRGREKLHYLNAAPIAELSDRWINRYHRRRVTALAGLKRALEEPSVSRPEFVYVTYIRTTPERLWEALTDPAFTATYWGATFDCDWAKGSSYRFALAGVRVEDPEQRVLESDPPRRLSYTWHGVSTELAQALDWSEAHLERLATEQRSKVSFDIEPVDASTVRLTVVHEGFEDGSPMLESVRGGWPRVLANLKTMLETGHAEPLVGARA
ncbi:MAG TPA: SRPBCC domain-containing protein [Acidimicrobiales bacterium]|nr:SRPBCC domain-containing protein [Acidimicrobiales bacterium]